MFESESFGEVLHPYPPGTLLAYRQKHLAYGEEALYLGTRRDQYHTYHAYAYFNIDQLWDYLPDWGYDGDDIKTFIDNWKDDFLWEYRDALLTGFRAMEGNDWAYPLPYHDGGSDTDIPMTFLVSIDLLLPQELDGKFRVLVLGQVPSLPRPELPLF